MRKEHHGFLFGMIAALSSATMALFIKLSPSISVPVLIFARFAMGVPLFLWIAHKKKIDLSWKKVPKNLTRNVGSILALYTYYYALHQLPLVNAITLANTAPLFMPFVTLVWLKLLVSKKRFLAAAIGFLGVIILLRPSGDLIVLGDVVGLASGLFGAIALVGVRILSKTENTETILAYYFFIGAVLTFFPIFIDWKPIEEPMQWFYLFLISATALIFQFTITKAFTHAPATKVSTVSYLAVVFGGLFGWWFLGEAPDYWVLVGAVLIICGALFALFDKTPPRPIGKS